MKVIRGSLFGLLTLVFLLLLAEVVLRFSVIRLDYDSVHQLDPRLIFRQLPNAEKRVSVATHEGLRRVIVHTNSMGFRGEELEQPGWGKRVAVYGDSFIAGEFSRSEDTFVERLEAQLATRSGTNVEAVNAGVISYGPDQALVKMQQELPLLSPDLIIFGIFASNDFGDLLRNKMFRLADDGRLVANDFVVSESLARSVEGARSRSLLTNVVRAAWKRLRQPPTPRDPAPPPIAYWLKLRRKEYSSFVIDGDNTVTNAIFDSFDVDMSLEPESASARYKERLMAAVVQEIQDTADAAGIPLVFLIIPSGIDVSQDYSWSIDEILHPGYQRDALCDALLSIFSKEGMQHLSLLEPYRKLDVNDIYFDWRDGHWNEEGQQVAAKLVADYILERGLLD